MTKRIISAAIIVPVVILAFIGAYGLLQPKSPAGDGFANLTLSSGAWFKSGTTMSLNPSTLNISVGSGNLTTTGAGGFGTTTPATKLDIYSPAGTSSIAVDSSATTKGGCIAIKNLTGSGYTYVSAAAGALVTSSISCQ